MRRVLVFDWQKVDHRLIRRLLEAAYRDQSPPNERQAAAVRRVPDDDLPRHAERVLGRLPQRLFTAGLAKVLHKHWIPRGIEREALEDLALLLQETVGKPSGGLTTRQSMVEFVTSRRMTVRHLDLLRKAFRRQHRTRREPASTSVEVRQKRVVHLSGSARTHERDWYQHQRDAWRQLDTRQFGVLKAAPPRGLVVLPTGAGKTDTIVQWLLNGPLQDKRHRVLWLAHRQELILQTAFRFRVLSESQPAGFSRQARLVFGGASPLSTIAHPANHVILATIQSTRRLVDQPRLLANLLDRPTFIVVDEAHHAAAVSYRRLLDAIEEQHAKRKCVTGILGLTATPWPSQTGARSALLERFGKVPVIKRSPAELTRLKILSVPIVHTIDTGERFRLTDSEARRAIADDLPPGKLTEIGAQLERDRLVVDVYTKMSQSLGKTLLFATSIEHADRLNAAMQSRGHHARAVHSRTGSRREAIAWFREYQGDSCVLTSVGMLTEGVDLPDARSVILARPTTSRILMRQMVGRALRGPRAGGDPEANIVFMRDDWVGFADILEPADVLQVNSAEAPRDTATSIVRSLPDLVDQRGRLIAPEIASELRREYQWAWQQLRISRAGPWAMSTSRLVGYYDVGDRHLPVLDHQAPALEELVATLAAGQSLQGRPPQSFFVDTPEPIPSAGALAAIVQYVREFGEPPPFVTLEVADGPEDLADRIRKAGPLTERQRAAMIEEAWRHSPAAIRHGTLDSFESAVDAALRQRRRPSYRHTLHPRERPSLPLVPSDPFRLLEPAVSAVTDFAAARLDPHLMARLDNLPSIDWTDRVVGSYFGAWTFARSGKNRGSKKIKINLLLRAPATVIPDSTLQFVVYHEVLHHLLPFAGHDEEFRTLESRWPTATEDAETLDTLEDGYDLDRTRYRRRATVG